MYIIKGSHIYILKGDEVYRANDPNAKTHRNRIFVNLAIQQGRAVTVEYKGMKYVVNDRGDIMSVST